MISTAVQDQEREVVHIGECRNKGGGWQEMVHVCTGRGGSGKLKESSSSENIDKTSLSRAKYASTYVCTSLGV
jgi:hypothetical protein